MLTQETEFYVVCICWMWCAWASKDSFRIERHVSSIKSLARTRKNEIKKNINHFRFCSQRLENLVSQFEARELSLVSFKCYNPFMCLYTVQMRSAFTKKYGRIREKRTKLHAIVHFSVKDCVCVSMDVLCIGFNSMFNWFVRDLDRVQIYIFSNFDRCRRENL